MTCARTAGIKSSRGKYVIFVDDDNVLAEDYLEQVITIFEKNAKMGVIGGKCIPEYEIEPDQWVIES